MKLIKSIAIVATFLTVSFSSSKSVYAQNIDPVVNAAVEISAEVLKEVDTSTKEADIDKALRAKILQDDYWDFWQLIRGKTTDLTMALHGIETEVMFKDLELFNKKEFKNYRKVHQAAILDVSGATEAVCLGVNQYPDKCIKMMENVLILTGLYEWQLESIEEVYANTNKPKKVRNKILAILGNPDNINIDTKKYEHLNK
ncbi:MAG: hypothetical protein QNJ72_07680 [Pleurocapsa sp. MO_226.B13]|nr:hypothetical protein [Pleurocapsa sp. MO_226.B13]